MPTIAHPDVRQLGTDGKRRHTVQQIVNEFWRGSYQRHGLSGFMIVSWFREYGASGPLGFPGEQIIAARSTATETVHRIVRLFGELATGLVDKPR